MFISDVPMKNARGAYHVQHVFVSGPDGGSPVVWFNMHITLFYPLSLSLSLTHTHARSWATHPWEENACWADACALCLWNNDNYELKWHWVERTGRKGPIVPFNAASCNVSESKTNGRSRDINESNTTFLQQPRELDLLQNVIGSSLARANPFHRVSWKSGL